jgi:DNA-directed RNA polymerase II subunit RPB1
MPINLARLIVNVKALNNIRHNSASDLEPKYFFTQLKELLNSFVTLPEARMKENIARSKIIEEAHINSTKLFKIYLRYHLRSRAVIFEHRMNQQTFDQLLTNIKETFRLAIVHPGEMVGSVAANSLGEPAT